MGGEVIVHGPGLGDVLVVPLAAGDHHQRVRVVVQISQGGVQPVLEENGGAPGLHLTAENHHHAGFPGYPRAAVDADVDFQRGEKEHRRRQ